MKNGAPNQFKLSAIAKDAIGKQYRYYYNKVFSMKEELKERVEGTSGGEIPFEEEEVSAKCQELSIIEHNALESKERHQYYHILGALDVATLKEWTSEVIKKYHENFKQIQIRNSKSSSLWSMFSWMSGASTEDEKGEIDQSTHAFDVDKSEFHISEEEIKEIDDIVQNAIEEENAEDHNDTNLLFQIEYRCIKGEINVEDDCESTNTGILIGYENCCFTFRKNFSREFEFKSSMKDMTVDLFFQLPLKTQLVYLPLFRSKPKLLQEINSKRGTLDNIASENHEIYEITILRNKSGSAVDFEFYFTVKPIYFYYRALLIKVIKSFTTLGSKSSEELKLNAWDKFQEMKGNTQEKIQTALLKTTNILSGSILDPKLVLPFTQNNDLNNPAYVLCLGNLKLNANKENLNEPLYQYINVSIKGTQFQYFESMKLWQKYEKDSLRQSLQDDEIFNGLNKSVFNVIEELEMYFKLGQRKKLALIGHEENSHAEFVVDGKVSDIRVNLTSERYNSLINFNKMIEISSKNFTNQILLHEKEDILNAATMAGYLRKRGDTLQYWNKQFAVLSGSYLYFYPENIDEAESYESWIYIKDAVVDVGEEDDDDLQNVFYVANQTTPVSLYVQDEETMKDWIKAIRERVYEIADMTEGFEGNNNAEDAQVTLNARTSIQDAPEAKIVEINLHFENLEYNMINDNFSKFLNFKVSEMSLTAETTTKGDVSSVNGKFRSYDNKYSHVIVVGIQKIRVNDVANDLVLVESFNQVNIAVNVLNKSSKRYKGDNLVLDFEFDQVKVNFLPVSVKKMITFFKRVDYEENNVSSGYIFNVYKSRNTNEETKMENEHLTLTSSDRNSERIKNLRRGSRLDRSFNSDAEEYMRLLASK